MAIEKLLCKRLKLFVFKVSIEYDYNLLIYFINIVWVTIFIYLFFNIDIFDNLQLHL